MVPGLNDADARTYAELKKASVWLGLAAAMALVVLLIQLLTIFGGLVFASMLDGGVRLLGKALPIPRGLRLAIVMILAIVFAVTVFIDRRDRSQAGSRRHAGGAGEPRHRLAGRMGTPRAPTLPGWCSRRWDRSGG